MAVIQIVRVEYRSGPKADLEAAMKSIVDTTQKADGCITSRLIQNSEKEDSYVILEEWESQEKANKDNEADYVVEFLDNYKDNLEISIHKFNIM